MCVRVGVDPLACKFRVRALEKQGGNTHTHTRRATTTLTPRPAADRSAQGVLGQDAGDGRLLL
jgi:hypothetical protein